MTTPIHPEALKYYRKRHHLTRTQEKLSQQTWKDPQGRLRTVSKATIKRIEAHEDGAYPAKDDVAEILAGILRVSTNDLGKEPPTESEDRLKQAGYRELRTMIDGETAAAFWWVRDLFGISIRSQIEMAPLFAALMAEGSLNWRRERIEEVEDAAERLMSLAGGHLSFAGSGWRAQEGASDERASIAKRDIFGKHVSDHAYDFGYDPRDENPFAAYLAEFAKSVNAETVTFEDAFDWKTEEGFPKYSIGKEIISRLTLDDPDAEYALDQGHVALADIPDDLDEEDRVAWLIAQVPEEELERARAARERLNETLSKIVI